MRQVMPPVPNAANRHTLIAINWAKAITYHIALNNQILCGLNSFQQLIQAIDFLAL